MFGEYLRYIRICSHEYLYDNCRKRLQAALVWWGYPQRVPSERYIKWTHRGQYMMTRAQRLRELEGRDMHTQDTVVATLSQVESEGNAGNDASGAVRATTHCTCATHTAPRRHSDGMGQGYICSTETTEMYSADQAVCTSETSKKCLPHFPGARTPDSHRR